jgi:Uma2 family endonuclease
MTTVASTSAEPQGAAGGLTGDRNAEILRQLTAWARRDGQGRAFDSSTGFVLPNGAMRSPDAAWVERSRLRQLSPAQREHFLPLCPALVVELRSPSDALVGVAAKMEEYVANGALLGWLIDPLRRQVDVYRGGSEVEALKNPETISGDPELPGLVLALEEIWEPDW